MRELARSRPYSAALSKQASNQRVVWEDERVAERVREVYNWRWHTFCRVMSVANRVYGSSERPRPQSHPKPAPPPCRDEATLAREDGGVDFKSRGVCCVPLRRRAWAVRHEMRPWPLVFVVRGMCMEEKRDTRERRKLVQLCGRFSFETEVLAQDVKRTHSRAE